MLTSRSWGKHPHKPLSSMRRMPCMIKLTKGFQFRIVTIYASNGRRYGSGNIGLQAIRLTSNRVQWRVYHFRGCLAGFFFSQSHDGQPGPFPSARHLEIFYSIPEMRQTGSLTVGRFARPLLPRVSPPDSHHHEHWAIGANTKWAAKVSALQVASQGLHKTPRSPVWR